MSLQEELLAGLATQPGFVCTKEDIETDKGMFSYSGVFQEVTAQVAVKNGKASFCTQQSSLCLAELAA